ATIVTSIFEWLDARKHSVVYCMVDKRKFCSEFIADERFADVNTLWRFMGLHLSLAIQKAHQGHDKNKGNTVLILDNEEREQTCFTELILNPPLWTDTYYNRSQKQDQLDQIVDAPYFADSRDVPLLQVADFVAFFLRRHAELETGDSERYVGERDQVRRWAESALQRSISSASYPKRGRGACADMFYTYAPACALR
ncbi:MAG: DUF3800 domain-containing protein, partial [Dehalococcoidia bacterium]|nr:DUF3800 domain-containing protein [Dehalococcoidia bacterium]